MNACITTCSTDHARPNVLRKFKLLAHCAIVHACMHAWAYNCGIPWEEIILIYREQLQGQSNNDCMFMRVCACKHVCVCGRVRLRMCVCTRLHKCVQVITFLGAGLCSSEHSYLVHHKACRQDDVWHKQYFSKQLTLLAEVQLCQMAKCTDTSAFEILH